MPGEQHKQRQLILASRKREPNSSDTTINLVPYLPHHVPQYHRWMCRAELLEATASEPLTLQEEYENQLSWSKDPFKWTFIILSPLFKENVLDDPCGLSGTSLGGMVGDVNIFLHDADAMDWMQIDDSSSLGPGKTSSTKEGNSTPLQEVKVGELEIMIAEPAVQRQGIGSLAIQCMMKYAWDTFDLRHFFVKVQSDNKASIRLFKSLGFQPFGPGPNVFGEITLIYYSPSLNEAGSLPFQYALHAYESPLIPI